MVKQVLLVNLEDKVKEELQDLPVLLVQLDLQVHLDHWVHREREVKQDLEEVRERGESQVHQE